MPVLSLTLVAIAALAWRSWAPVALTLLAAAGSLAMTVVGKSTVGRVRLPWPTPSALRALAVLPLRAHPQHHGDHRGADLPAAHAPAPPPLAHDGHGDRSAVDRPGWGSRGSSWGTTGRPTWSVVGCSGWPGFSSWWSATAPGSPLCVTTLHAESSNTPDRVRAFGASRTIWATFSDSGLRYGGDHL